MNIIDDIVVSITNCSCLKGATERYPFGFEQFDCQ